MGSTKTLSMNDLITFRNTEYEKYEPKLPNAALETLMFSKSLGGVIERSRGRGLASFIVNLTLRKL